MRLQPIPRVVDNDHDEITIEFEGRELRGWSYFDEEERKVKIAWPASTSRVFATLREAPASHRMTLPVSPSKGGPSRTANPTSHKGANDMAVIPTRPFANTSARLRRQPCCSNSTPTPVTRRCSGTARSRQVRHRPPAWQEEGPQGHRLPAEHQGARGHARHPDAGREDRAPHAGSCLTNFRKSSATASSVTSSSMRSTRRRRR